LPPLSPASNFQAFLRRLDVPTYDFECEKCGHHFSVVRHMSERATVPACPKCRAKAVRQVFGVFYAKTIKKS